MATGRVKRRKWQEDELDAGVIPPAIEKPEAGEGPDQISNLPMDVLGSIVSLLPTKDGARTQSLSTRWRHLFRSVPLNLGLELRRRDEPAPSSLVSRILADHQAPCRRLSLTWYGYKPDFVSPLLTRWLQSPALDGLSEFDLWQHRSDNGREKWRVPRADPHTLPPSVLRLSATLRILSIKCTGNMIRLPFMATVAGDVHFPHLKQLTFKGVIISEGDLHGVLAGCPVLESLVLSELDGVHGVRINSSTLRRLGVSSGYSAEPQRLLQQVIVEDAPNLQKLFLSGIDRELSVRVLCAPKLDFLGSLPEGFTKANLETTFLQRTAAASLMSVMRTVKVLVLSMSPPSVDDAITFVTFFPCLENLYVVLSRNKAFRRARHCFPLPYIECFELHLKKIVLINYYGSKKDVDLANFCLLHARVLERLEFAARLPSHQEKCDPGWIDDQISKLKFDNVASQGVEIDFSGDSYCGREIHISDIHNLTVTDPFDRSLCQCHTVDFL